MTHLKGFPLANMTDRQTAGVTERESQPFLPQSFPKTRERIRYPVYEQADCTLETSVPLTGARDTGKEEKRAAARRCRMREHVDFPGRSFIPLEMASSSEPFITSTPGRIRQDSRGSRGFSSFEGSLLYLDQYACDPMIY